MKATLEDLIEAARRVMERATPEQRDKMLRDGAISFAYGNVKMHNPDIRREDVEAAYDQLKRHKSIDK